MFRLDGIVAEDMLRALLRRIESGGYAPELRLYGGTMPRSTSPVSAEPIGIVELLRPAGTISGAALTLRFVEDAVARRGGSVGWGRLVNGADETIFDVNAGTKDAALELNYAEYIEGGPIVVRRLVIVQPTQEP